MRTIAIPYDDFTKTEKPDCELNYIGTEELRGPIGNGWLRLYSGSDGQYYVHEEGVGSDPRANYEKWLVSDDASKIQALVDASR